MKKIDKKLLEKLNERTANKTDLYYDDEGFINSITEIRAIALSMRDRLIKEDEFDYNLEIWSTGHMILGYIIGDELLKEVDKEYLPGYRREKEEEQ